MLLSFSRRVWDGNTWNSCSKTNPGRILWLRPVCPGNHAGTTCPQEDSPRLVSPGRSYSGVEDVPPQDPMWNASSVLFVGNEWCWVEKRWNLKGRAGYMTLDKLLNYSLFHHLFSFMWELWDHACKCFSWLLTQSRRSIYVNFKISLLGRIRDLLPGDENQEGLPLGQVGKSWPEYHFVFLGIY